MVDLSKVQIPYNDSLLVIPNIEGALEKEGRLSKLWVTDIESNRQYLVKSSCFYGYEPISEKLAYIIGHHLGFDCLKYDLIDAHYLKGVLKINFCKYLSICERLDINGWNISCVRDIKRAREATSGQKVLNRDVFEEILPERYRNNLLIYDAIIGNTDRHYGNVHLLLDKEGNITGSPFMDNGASLLATYSMLEVYLAGKNFDSKLDKSFTIEKQHKLQVEHIESDLFKNVNITNKILEIDDAIQDTLKLLPRPRAKKVEKYIINRLYKYLTMFR